ERQLVDSSHIESGVAELPCTRHVLVQSRDLRVELTCEIARECRQDDTWLNTIGRCRGLGQSHCTMDEDNGLAGSRSPGQPDRTAVVTPRPAPLSRMKEASPRLEVATFGNALELLFVIDLSKAQLRRRSFQPGDQSIVFALLGVWTRWHGRLCIG